MGNFHCIPESCARVVWREYLPPKIRWRYPDEDWQEIEGDDYAIEQEQGQCYTQYIAFGFVYRSTGVINRFGSGGINPYFFGKVKEVIYSSNYATSTSIKIISEDINGNQAQYNLAPYRVLNDEGYTVTSTRIVPYSNILSMEITEYVRIDNKNDGCGDCIFTVYQNEQIVYQETRDICPEVEKLDCHLSDEYKEIKIEKLLYLERIEVTDWAYQNFGLNVFRANIPDECLNIYKNYTTTIIPLPGGVPTPTSSPFSPYGFIAQICSAPNCPPPEYQVICNCNDCESCPPETCPVECGEHICCYNDLGVSVKQIDISNYCG